MPNVVSTLEFDAWLKCQSIPVKARVLARIRHMQEGNNGDCQPVGEGVSESRIHHGPGIRLYFLSRNGELVVLLGGGDKSTQQADIERARELAKTTCK
jgi:putative addiction module killer protein